MAESILRLKVDSQQYDAQLKRASQGLQKYIDGCRQAGGTLAVVEEDTLRFVRAMGEMPTVAQGATQGLREMTRVTAEMTLQYRSLTDEEKASPFGQALAQNIQTLTERAGNMRDAMDDATAAIKNAASDTRVFDQLSGAATLVTSSFQTLQGGAKLLGLEMGNDVEVIAKLQAAMAVTNGLSQIQNTLQQQSAVMQGVAAIQTRANATAQALLAKNTGLATAAGRVFNAVAKANPYVLLASAAVAAGTAILAFSRRNREAADEVEASSKAMETAREAAESYSKSMASEFGTLMGKYSELKRGWQELSDEHAKAAWIEENRKALNDLGLSIDSVSAAEQAFSGDTEEIVDGFRRRAEAAALSASMVDLYRRKMENELQQSDRLSQISVSAGDRVSRQVASNIQFKRDAGSDTYNGGLYRLDGHEGQAIRHYVFTDKGAEQYNSSLSQTDKTLKELSDEFAVIDDRIESADQRLRDLSSTAQKAVKDTSAAVAGSTSQPSGITNNATSDVEEVSSPYLRSKAGLDSWIRDISDELSKADFGSDLYDSLTSQLADANMLRSLIEESLATGLGTALFDVADESGKDFWQRVLSPEGVEDADWQGIADAINAKRKELGLEAITIDVATGSVSEVIAKPESGRSSGTASGSGSKKDDLSAGSNALLDQSKQVVSGLGQVSSGLQQAGVELPDGIKNVISVVQGVMTVVDGFKTISMALDTAGQAAQNANTTALIGLTTAISANTAAQVAGTAAKSAGSIADVAKAAVAVITLPAGGMALRTGGVVRAAQGFAVPGTHYSGDVTPILANAGELLLNRAQQGNLVSQLEGAAAGGSASGIPYVTGQTIYLGLNNHLRASGQGELVTTRYLQRHGITL